MNVEYLSNVTLHLFIYRGRFGAEISHITVKAEKDTWLGRYTILDVDENPTYLWGKVISSLECERVAPVEEVYEEGLDVFTYSETADFGLAKKRIYEWLKSKSSMLALKAEDYDEKAEQVKYMTMSEVLTKYEPETWCDEEETS